MRMKCIVIDDEYLARLLLSDYISKIPHLELVASCETALEALNVIQNEEVDLMFLDIQMPELSGIDFLKSLTQKPLVIFTTAYPEYAIDGYALDVIDYLLKPFPFERFLLSVNKATTQINLLKNKQGNSPKYISIKSEHRIYKVGFQEIKYIEGLKEYVTFYLTNGKKIVTLESLKKLENTLPQQFIRVHRSYIVNKNEVSSLYGNMIEIGEAKISIGATYKEEVVKQLFI